MKQYKSVGEVLRIGQIYINGIVILLMIFVWVVSVFVSNRVVPENYSTGVILIGIVFGFIVGWLYWSLAIPKWRIWAFKNTNKNNWLELKRRAINEKLIWSNDSIFNKTEIRSNADKTEIAIIEKEILTHDFDDTLDNVEDDKSLPDRTEYYYAKSELILNPIIFLVFICMGIYLISEQRIVLGGIGILFAIYNFSFKLFKNLLYPKVQMIISNDGIQMNIKNVEFVKWSDTRNITLNSAQSELTLEVRKNNIFCNVTYDVRNLGMRNREDMIRKINIYSKRNQIKAKAKNR